MIWPTPYLQWNDFVRWFNPKRSSELRPSEYQGILWQNSGAEAISYICENLIVSSKSKSFNIWLPAYFCGQSLRYLRSVPVKIHFYQLNSKLLPDFNWLADATAKESVDIFVHVHYFGRVSGQSESRIFSDSKNAVFIEDCAHVISPQPQNSWLGDYLVFSPHKHFPLPKVGVIISRKSFKDSTGQQNDKFPIAWVLRQLFRRTLKRTYHAMWQRQWNGDIVKSSKNYPYKDTIKVAGSYLVDYFSAYEIRRKHVGILNTLLVSMSGWQPLLEYSDSDVPYLFGMICDSPLIAQERFNILNKRYKLVMQWPDLPNEIRDRTDVCEFSCDLVDRTLFFFVHQQLNTNQWQIEIKRAMTQIGRENG